MSMSSIPSSSPGGKRYGWVEKIGNKVPHPFLLFIYLIAVLIAATAILSALNLRDQHRGGKVHRCLFARQRDRQLVLYGDLGDRSDARRRTDHR